MQRKGHPLHAVFLKACGYPADFEGDLPDPPTDRAFQDMEIWEFYPDGHKVFDYADEEEDYYRILAEGGYVEGVTATGSTGDDYSDNSVESWEFTRKLLEESFLGKPEVEEPKLLSSVGPLGREICKSLTTVASLHEDWSIDILDGVDLESSSRMICAFLLADGKLTPTPEVEEEIPPLPFDGQRYGTVHDTHDNQAWFRGRFPYLREVDVFVQPFRPGDDVEVQILTKTWRNTWIQDEEATKPNSWFSCMNMLDQSEVFAVESYILMETGLRPTIIQDRAFRILSGAPGQARPGKLSSRSRTGPHRLEIGMGHLTVSIPIRGRLSETEWRFGTGGREGWDPPEGPTPASDSGHQGG